MTEWVIKMDVYSKVTNGSMEILRQKSGVSQDRVQAPEV